MKSEESSISGQLVDQPLLSHLLQLSYFKDMLQLDLVHQEQLRPGVHHLHLRLTVPDNQGFTRHLHKDAFCLPWAVEDEAHGVAAPSITVGQLEGVDNKPWLVVWQRFLKLLHSFNILQHFITDYCLAGLVYLVIAPINPCSNNICMTHLHHHSTVVILLPEPELSELLLQVRVQAADV